jgi:magnesium chelatase family protein
MSARAVDRLLRAARTIADLTGTDRIDVDCLREAASYRALDVEPAASAA